MGNPSGHEGWFYKQGEKRFGPVSRLQLRELVMSGQLPPKQAVWKEGKQSLFFVCAETAVAETENRVS